MNEQNDGLETLVVSVPSSHPSGQRCRAGFKFTSSPKPVRVNAEEKKMIEDDPYLTIHQRHSRAWFTAQGLEFTEDNVEEYADKDPTPEQLEENEAEEAEQVVKGPETIPTKQEQQKGISVTSSKEDVIKALEEKGLSAGVDFDPEATRNDLVALYKDS